MKKLPDGWVIKLFEECIEKEISANKLKIPQNGFQLEGKYPIIDQGVEYITGFTDDSSKVYKGELPVIIFGDHTRIFKFVDFPFALGADGTKILVPKKFLHPKYFYFFLNGLIIENHGYSRHYKFLKDKQIVIPPLPTQEKIAAVLEKAEKLREWRKEADGLTDEFLKSIFLEMFGDPRKNPKGWPVVMCNKICCSISVGIVVKPASYYVPIGIPALRSLNIKKEGLNLKELVYVSEEDNNQQLSKSKIKEGDVLIVRTGYTGTACIVPKELDEANCIDLVIARPNPDIIESSYLCTFFNSSSGKNQTSSAERGIAQKHLNVGAVNKTLIPVPPLELQQKFTSIVQQVKLLRQYQEQSKQQIDNLFNILMQKAFNGGVT